MTLETASSRVTGPASSTGTFALSVSATAGEEISIRYNQSAPAAVRVPGIPPPGGPMPPQPIPGVPPVTSTAVPGRVLVRGQTNEAPGRSMLGVNPALGEVVTAIVAADRTFQLELPATSGQQLRVYDDGLLENAWVLTVP